MLRTGQRGGSQEKDVAVGLSGLVAVIHELGIGANLAVVASNEFDRATD